MSRSNCDSASIQQSKVFSRHGTDPAVPFLHRLTEKHNLDETMFLVDCYGYSTALARLELSGRRDHTDRNHIERCPASS